MGGGGGGGGGGAEVAGEAAAWALAGAPGARPGDLDRLAQAAWAGAQAPDGGLRGPAAASWLHLLGALGVLTGVPAAQRGACQGAVLAAAAGAAARPDVWAAGAPEILAALCYCAAAAGDGGLPAVGEAVVSTLGAAEAGEGEGAPGGFPCARPFSARVQRLDRTLRAFAALAEGRLDVKGAGDCPSPAGLAALAGALLDAASGGVSPGRENALLLAAATGLASGLGRRPGSSAEMSERGRPLQDRIVSLAEGRLAGGGGALADDRQGGAFCSALGLALCHFFTEGGALRAEEGSPGRALPPHLAQGFLAWFYWRVLHPGDLFRALQGPAGPPPEGGMGAGAGAGAEAGTDAVPPGGTGWWLEQHIRADGPLHEVLRRTAPVCAATLAALPAPAMHFPVQQLHLLARQCAAAYDAQRGALGGLPQQPLAQYFGQVYFLVSSQLEVALHAFSAAGGDLCGGSALASAVDTLALLEFCKVPGLRVAARALHMCLVLLERGGSGGFACALHSFPRLGPGQRSPGPAADSRLLFYLKLAPLLVSRAGEGAFRGRVLPTLSAGMRHAEAQVCATASEAVGLVLGAESLSAPDAEGLFREFLEAAQGNFPERLPLQVLAQALGGYLGRVDTTRAGVGLFCSELLRMCVALEASGDGEGSEAIRRILLESLAVVDVRQMGLVLEAVGGFIAAARGERRERYLCEVLGWIPSVVDYVRKPFIVDWYQRLAACEGRAGAPGREAGRGRGWWVWRRGAGARVHRGRASL